MNEMDEVFFPCFGVDRADRTYLEDLLAKLDVF